MKRFKKLLRAIAVSNVVIAGLILAGFPAMPAFAIAKSVSKSTSGSGIVLADVDILERAGDHLEEAALAVDAIAKSKTNAEQHHHFATAIYALKSAADALDKAGLTNAAVAVDRALAAINAASSAADSGQGRKVMIEAAIKALDQMEVAIDRVAS